MLMRMKAWNAIKLVASLAVAMATKFPDTVRIGMSTYGAHAQ